MKYALLVILAVGVPALGRADSGCLIVKRQAFFYGYVESTGLQKVKRAYDRGELRKLEKAGVNVEIVPGDYTKADLERAHSSCQKGSGAPVAP